MSIRTDRRDEAIEKMAEHILAHGLEAATLRQLATAVGTSDRMLLYYFSDRDELLALTLKHIASRLAVRLDQCVSAGARRPLAALLSQVWAALQRDELRPYMTVWLELSAQAAGGREPHSEIAGSIADFFAAWAFDRLEGRTAAERRVSASLLIVAVNGMHVLRTIRRDGIADAALVGLSKGFNPS